MSLAEEIIAGKKSVSSLPPGAGGASKIDAAAPPYAGRGMVHPAIVAQTAAANVDPAKAAPVAPPVAPASKVSPLAALPGDMLDSAGNMLLGAGKAAVGTIAAPFAAVGDAGANAVASMLGRERPDPHSTLDAVLNFASQGAGEAVKPFTDTAAIIGNTAQGLADDAGWKKAPPAVGAPVAPTVAPKPAAPTLPAGNAGRGTVNPPAVSPTTAPATPAPTAPEALPTAGAPSPSGPSAGTITIGGKTIQIPATGDLPAIPKVGATPGFIPGAAGGYVGGPIGGAPAGPVDSNGNGTTRTAELRAQLETQRADQAHDNELNQASLAASQATTKEAEAKRAAWEQEVADSSILNRPTAPYGTPAQMQAQVAMAQIQQQAKNARMQNQGMIRGQDIQARGQDVSAKTAEKGHEVQKRGQDVSAGVQTRGQDVQVQTTGMNNATQTANAHLTAATQTGIAAGNNAVSLENNTRTNAAHLEAAKLSAKAQADHAALTAQGWHPSPTMPGQYFRTAQNGEIQFYDPMAMAAAKGAPKKGS